MKCALAPLAEGEQVLARVVLAGDADVARSRRAADAALAEAAHHAVGEQQGQQHRRDGASMHFRLVRPAGMMSLWAPDGTMRNQGDPQSPYVGSAALKSYWQKSGSFMNRRFSLVPSYKTQIEVSGDKAWLYFECHDIGEYDKPARTIAVDTFLAGTLRRVEGRWLFFDMTAGKSSPPSLDHYYFPPRDAGLQASR